MPSTHRDQTTSKQADKSPGHHRQPNSTPQQPADSQQEPEETRKNSIVDPQQTFHRLPQRSLLSYPEPESQPESETPVPRVTLLDNSEQVYRTHTKTREFVPAFPSKSHELLQLPAQPPGVTMNIDVVGRIRPSITGEGASNLHIDASSRVSAQASGPYFGWVLFIGDMTIKLDFKRFSHKGQSGFMSGMSDSSITTNATKLCEALIVSSTWF